MERPVTYTDPLAQETMVEYDGNLNAVSTTDRRGRTTTYDYDLANQLTEVDAPATGAWQFGYDARGNRDEITDPRLNQTEYSFDLADRLVQADEPETTTTAYDYDPAGNLVSVLDPNSHETTFDYDPLGRLAAIGQPLGKTTAFDYDPAGNLVERTTAENAIEFAYDDANRVTSISDGVDSLRSFAYDDAGRLVEATDAQSKTLAFGYDDDDNLTSIDDDRGQTVSRSFDSRANLTSQTDGRGSLSYVYDELNRMSQLTGAESEILNFSYDQEGNLTETELPNGVVTTNAYDHANRMLETSSVNGSTVLQTFDYVYDAAGNRVTQTDRNSDQTTYEYDDLNRLIEFNGPSDPAVAYAYDDAGNRTDAGATSYTYNALNQLTVDSTGTTYDYDGAGRLVDVDDGSQTTGYEWDALDQLLEVDDGSDPISYSYDGLGRRSERTAATTETAHYGDLTDHAIVDTDPSGVTSSFLGGPGGLVEQGTGAPEFPLADAHGDITTVVDDVGSVSSRQEFDPWGQQLLGPALQLGWLGGHQRRSDPDAGLVQMGVRPFEPATARFGNEDVVLGLPGAAQSLNRYSYAWNSPLSLYDLSGRFPDLCPAFLPFCPDPTDPSSLLPGDGAHLCVGDVFVRPIGGSACGAESETISTSSSIDQRCNALLIGTCLLSLMPDGFGQALAEAGASCAAGAAWAMSATPALRNTRFSPFVAGAGCLGGAAVGNEFGGLPLPPIIAP